MNIITICDLVLTLLWRFLAIILNYIYRSTLLHLNEEKYPIMNFLLKKTGFVAAIALMTALAPVTKSAAQTYNDDYVDYNDGYSASYQDFYDGLSPYGQWIQDPQYGYVWLPNVGPDFRPYYSGGHWVMTQYGNTWVSDYPWGWAPFHYGRWTYDSYYGWLWIPGTQWGPAWVNWRSSNDYYGWAPLGPGISISLSFGWACPTDWWVFIPNRYIYNPRFQGYYRGPRYNQTIINNTTIIHNTYINNSSHTTYITGPRANEIQHVTNQRVNVYNINNGARPGATTIQNNTVNIYRPSIRKGNTAQVAPREIVKPQQAIGRPQAISVNNGRPEGREAVLNQRPVQNVRPQQQIPSGTRIPASQAPQNTNINRQPPQNVRPQQQEQPQQPMQQPQRANWNNQPAQQSRPQQQQIPQQQPQPRPQPVQQPQRANWNNQPAQQPRPQQQPQPRPQPMPQPQRMEQPRPQPMPQPQHMEQARPAPMARPSR